MNKKEKNEIIDELTARLNENKNFYLADTSTLTGVKVNNLRRICFEKKVEMRVVKNTLLHKALEKSIHAAALEPVYDTLKGNTALMFGEQPSDPARIITQFRIENSRPLLKAAFVEESVYIGDDQLAGLSSLKTKNELIGDIIGLL